METMNQDNLPHIYNQNFSVAQSCIQLSQNFSSAEIVQFFKTYKAISNCVSVQKLLISQKSKIRRYKQSVYYGQFEQQIRSGQGIMLYYDKRVYEGTNFVIQGEWKNGHKDGKGFELFSDESSYQGEYKVGKPSGVGKFTWKNKDFYEGQWLQGLRHGIGFWQSVGGDSYSGEWEKGQANGFGINLSANGGRYQGEFKNSLKHGHGIQTFSNKDIYKGNFKNGLLSGCGQYFWVNGAYFKGTYQNGLKNGKGFWKSSQTDFETYEGYYQNDKKQGFGTFTWKDGSVYKGYFVDNLRHGYGEMKWINNIYYKGQWYKGVQHGPGEIYHPQDGLKKGLFQNNILIKLYYSQKIKQYQIKQQPQQKLLNRQKTSNISEQQQMPKTIKFNTQNGEFRKRFIKSRKNTKSITIMLNTQSKSRHKRNKSFTASLKSVQTINLNRINTINQQQQTSGLKRNKILHSNQTVFNIKNRIMSHVQSQASDNSRINLVTTKQYCNKHRLKIQNLANIYTRNFCNKMGTTSSR